MTRALNWGQQRDITGALTWEPQLVDEQTTSGLVSSILESAQSASSAVIGDIIDGNISLVLDEIISTSSTQLGIVATQNSSLDSASISAQSHTWDSQTFNGVIPNDVNWSTVSLYWLAVNDLGFTPVAGDIFHHTVDPSLTFDPSSIPLVNPAQDITGEYYWEDGTTQALTPINTFVIDRRVMAEAIQTVENYDLVSSAFLSNGVISSAEVGIENITASASAVVELTSNATSSLDSLTIIALGALGDQTGYINSNLVSSSLFSSGVLSGNGAALLTLDETFAASLGTLLIESSASFPLDNYPTSMSGTQGGIVGDVSYTTNDDIVATSSAITNYGQVNRNIEPVFYAASASLEHTSYHSAELEDVVVTVGGLYGDTPIALGIFSLEDIAASSFGSVSKEADVYQDLDSTTLQGSASLTNRGLINYFSYRTEVNSDGEVEVLGDYIGNYANPTITISGLISQPITISSLSIIESSNVQANCIIGEVGSLITAVVNQMNIWLPPENILDEPQLESLVVPIFRKLGMTPDRIPEALCKSLEAAALLNKAKATTSYGLSKEKIDRVEYHYSTNAKSPSDLWDDYIKTLPQICPLFGYEKRISPGIIVNPGRSISHRTRSPTNPRESRYWR